MPVPAGLPGSRPSAGLPLPAIQCFSVCCVRHLHLGDRPHFRLREWVFCGILRPHLDSAGKNDLNGFQGQGSWARGVLGVCHSYGPLKLFANNLRSPASPSCRLRPPWSFPGIEARHLPPPCPHVWPVPTQPSAPGLLAGAPPPVGCSRLLVCVHVHRGTAPAIQQLAPRVDSSFSRTRAELIHFNNSTLIYRSRDGFSSQSYRD